MIAEVAETLSTRRFGTRMVLGRVNYGGAHESLQQKFLHLGPFSQQFLPFQRIDASGCMWTLCISSFARSQILCQCGSNRKLRGRAPVLANSLQWGELQHVSNLVQDMFKSVLLQCPLMSWFTLPVDSADFNVFLGNPTWSFQAFQCFHAIFGIVSWTMLDALRRNRV